MEALLGTKIQLKKKIQRVWDDLNGQNESFGGGNQVFPQQNNGPNDWFSQGVQMGYQWVEDERQKQQYQLMAPSNNIFSNPEIGQILEQQIIYMEASPQEKILKELREKGGVFKDDRFPPNHASLVGEYKNTSNWSQIKWERISTLLPNPKIFEGKVEPNDIAQGYLGDCYFLAGLAALAERPSRIFNLFLITEQNPQKYYSVKMLYRGKWVTIDMDEYIPVLYKEPAFSKSKNKELWVVLLEKAWAKLYTSYKRIEAGYPEEPLHDLTGAPIRQIHLRHCDKEKEWQYLRMASQRAYSMVCSSQPGSDTHKSASGIVQGHAYTLMKVVEVRYGHHNQSERLVQLRNPWGKSESTVQWSDNDARWNSVSQQEKRRIGYSNNKNDGTFFMTYQHFAKEFRAITIAEINDNASYVYQSHKDRHGHGCYFKLRLIQRGNYCLMVDKTPQRSFPESMWDIYRYPNARVEIGRLEGGQRVRMLEGVQSSRRTLFKEYEGLDAGEYIVFVKMDFNSQYEKDYDVNLAVYSEIPVQISFASNAEACMFHGRQVVWDGKADESSEVGRWNNLGNIEWGNNSQYGGFGNNGGGNNGWGNNNNNSSNDGWGENFNNGNNGNNGNGNNNNQKNDGWGDYFGGGGNNGGNNNNGGGNNGGNNNNGWGNSGGNNNNGWGNNNNGNNNNGWGNSGGNNNNDWGNNNNGNNNQNNKFQQNDGWGNYFDKGNGGNSNANSGWGSGNSNNGWGTNNNSNSGWGNNTNPNNNQKNNNNKFQQNDGWGDYFDNKGNKGGNNNSNNGWGSNNGW